MHKKSAVSCVLAAILFALSVWVGTDTPKSQEPRPWLLLEEMESERSNVVTFIGPKRPNSHGGEAEIFNSPVSILHSNGETILSFQRTRGAISAHGASIEGADIRLSTDRWGWLAVVPISNIEMSVGQRRVSLAVGEILLFYPTGIQYSNPSIEMVIWRDDLFAQRLSYGYFTVSGFHPSPQIPIWISANLD